MRGSSGAQGVRADSRALSLCYAFSFFSTTVCQEGRRIVDESSLEKHLEDGTSCRRGGKRERERRKVSSTMSRNFGLRTKVASIERNAEKRGGVARPYVDVKQTG